MMTDNLTRPYRVILMAIMVFLMALGTARAFSIPGLGKAQKVTATGDQVIIPAAKVTGGKAQFYRITDNGKEIGFFVVRGGDGNFRVAFDACDACYREKKGYEQKDDRMVCRNCNMKFAVDRLGPNATGGCNPSYLPHRENGGNIVISLADLRAGARFF